MKIVKGTEGVSCSWQDDFPKTAPCDCGGEARLAFVFQEDGGEDDGVRVCAYHENKPNEEFWPHDAIAVAVYFCKKCFKAVTLWNQA